MKKESILVLCTGNSCRSQIAEGFLRFFLGQKALVFSAGIEVHGLNPLAISTMKQIGIDISSHTSNHVDEYKNNDFDYIITVCDHAFEYCPYFPSNARRVHHNFPDPAKAVGNEDEIKKQFALVREQIKNYCQQFVENNF